MRELEALETYYSGLIVAMGTLGILTCLVIIYIGYQIIDELARMNYRFQEMDKRNKRIDEKTQ